MSTHLKIKKKNYKELRYKYTISQASILFTLKSKLVKEELVARAWEREVAPESPI